ncbi:disintegrin and metalloproteinase domain-containing protein 10-like isoform X2 [Venturia canescens]|uniref:disintegrin and metalloproteinase domain-containing protein 10-like isoform X2 n=1 Tax=Venturia canescens TaxID=32260 RepID=UPI001C9D145C|nr:disintegrin and metalloproteinase domain-containing protein 10-like isoform X2 [Venturia canescens]
MRASTLPHEAHGRRHFSARLGYSTIITRTTSSMPIVLPILWPSYPCIKHSQQTTSLRLLDLALITLVWLIAVADTSPLPQPVPPHTGITRGSYIGHYGIAWYDATALRSHRNRVRRDTSEAVKDQPLVLRLHALDKHWTMRLVRDNNLFAKDATFEGTEGPIPFDMSHSYVGTIDGDENAVVQGLITEDGLFDGTVATGFEEYYIEPSSRYLEGNENTSPSYHTIAYRASDVTTPPHPRRCPSHELHRGTLQDSFYRDREFSNKTGGPFYERLQDNEVRKHGGFYSKEAKIRSDTAEKNESLGINRERFVRHLHKRETVDPRKTTCMLYLQADHQFFARYGTEEACIEVMTRHVQRVNSIYKHTDFNQDGRPDNISFMIKRVKVHSGEALRDPNYRFPGNYGVEKFLELFSEEDYDAFCLAYMFTYRDFEMGTLGLAWTGDLKNAGGVCEKNGHYRGSMKSLNTGIVTLLNYGKHVPPAVSHVTLAHEIGHNFGSPHDPEQCTPGGENGNFIMFARATSGDKRNNNRFSPCSLNSINPVLNTKARSPKGCFTEPQASLCGNGVVEEGEECDCGWGEDCRDSCCFPQRRYPPAEETPCTLTPGSICSPSQGPCCTTECKLRFGDKCRDDNGCRDASFCDGRAPYCPPSINKPNKTICNQELVCFMGECTGSICLAYGLESCQCIPGPNDLQTKACELCCRLPGENQPCLSSFDWNAPPYDIPDMFSKPGTPCNDYNGYCDVFQKCREVDPSGPLATLRKLLLSDESLATFRRWVSDHWYAVALIVLGAISLLVASIRFLGKRPDLKLKSVTIIHSSTTETVRLPPEGTEGVTVHPPAVRAKLPLSRKVREKRRHRKHKDTIITVGNNNDKSTKVVKKKKKKRVGPVSVEEQPARKRIAEVANLSVAAQDANNVPGKKPTKESPTNEIGAVGTVVGAGQQTGPVSVGLVGIIGGGSGGLAASKKKRKKKEVIDYSAAQAENESPGGPGGGAVGDNADPKSKVRSWLLASQCRVERTSSSGLPKSKSTPVGLTSTRVAASRGVVGAAGRVRQVTLRRLTDPKARSAGSLTRSETKNDRVRLQVVYKPPFKFSVKLRKADKVGQMPGNHAPATTRNNTQIPRTGVLVRTTGCKKSKDRVRTSHGKQMMIPGNGRSNSAMIQEPANSDVHTVPSDLEVLLSESEFLFSDA